MLAGAVLAFSFAPRRDELARSRRGSRWPAVAFIAWASVSLLWALDVEQGSIELLFFVFPFSALVAAVARAPYADWLPRALAVTLVGLATLFAAIGLYQAWSHTLIFAQDLRVANAYTTYFRVTSLFKDPSIYGRHLVLAISLLVVLLWLARVRLAYALVLVAVLFGGLYFSYSQSSMVVLFVTLLAVDVPARRPAQPEPRDRGRDRLRDPWRRVRPRASAKDTGLRRATSGRSRLVSLTTTVIREPSRRRRRHRQPAARGPARGEDAAGRPTRTRRTRRR